MNAQIEQYTHWKYYKHFTADMRNEEGRLAKTVFDRNLDIQGSKNVSLFYLAWTFPALSLLFSQMPVATISFVSKVISWSIHTGRWPVNYQTAHLPLGNE